jgi:ATP-dependent DNA helicase 2 subunit 2
MGKMREIEVPTESGKPSKKVQITNLEWALRFVMLKVQELVSKELVTPMSYN